MKRRDFMLLMFSYVVGCTTPISIRGERRPKAAKCIVLDDAGSSTTSISYLERLVSARVPANVAVLPKSRYEAQTFDILADYPEADVLLHQPMEPYDLRNNPPEDDLRKRGQEYDPAIHTAIYSFDSSDIAYRITRDNAERLDRGLKKRGHGGITGLNNHMGSLATEDKGLTRGVCQYAQDNGLIVVDSRTSSKSVLYDTARQMGLKAYRNNMFIDGDTEKKLSRLLKTGKDAVAIGHLQDKATVDEYIRMARRERFYRLSEIS